MITRDIPIEPNSDEILKDPHYPVRDARNTKTFEKYRQLAKLNSDVLFGGRLGEYKYYDMDQVVGSAIAKATSALKDSKNPTSTFVARSA